MDCIEIYKLSDLKLRPIVAGLQSATQRSIYIYKHCVHKYLVLFVMKLIFFTSYILSSRIILYSQLMTSQVHTQIFHMILAFQQCDTEWKRYTIAGRFRTEFIIKDLRIILEENSLNFDGHTNRQTKGTAIGTKVAPSYENLVMAYLEEKMYDEIGDRFHQIFK